MNRITKLILIMTFLIMWLSARQLYAGSPSMVLDGTDVKDLKDYRFSRLEPKAGDYYSENGGGGFRIEIRKKGNSFQVRRQYIEPGLTPQTRVYKGFQRSKGCFFQAKGAQLRVTDDGGIFFLEHSSGIKSFSEIMWIYLSPKT